MKISRTPEGYLLEAEQWVPAQLDDVFAFFARAENLETITPPFLGFKILSKSTPEIEQGTIIEYRLKIHGLPARWTTRIEIWKSGKEFVDNQLRGPYALWHHTHTFEARDGGTLMRDRVRFRLPLGWLGDLLAGWLVRRDVRQIFAYRGTTIERLFPKS